MTQHRGTAVVETRERSQQLLAYIVCRGSLLGGS
jgi:hypothetical protein